MRLLPVLDLRSDDVVGRFGHAVRELGCFQVVGHGIPPALIKELFASTLPFFALPAEVKAQVGQPAPDQVRGWSGVGREGVSYSLDEESPGDLKEKFDIGPPDVPDQPYYSAVRAGPHFAPNLWPPSQPAMRQVWERYYAEIAAVGRRLLRVGACSLGLPEDTFDRTLHREISMLRALWYPPQPEPPLPGQLRAGMHSDYGLLTIISAQDKPGGLQILDRHGEWFDATTTPGDLVVLVGDLLAQWTDDRFGTTLHRVANPDRDRRAETGRLAFAFYQHPDYDVRIDVVPGLPGGVETPDDDIPTSGDHLREKYVRQSSFGSRWVR